jgi:hypothetical protein
MCQAYQQRPEEERKPMIMTAEGMELGRSPLWKGVDTNRFLVSLSLLQKSNFSTSTSAILPLLRCLGVAHSLRLVSALISERRILLVSSSATRLSTCVRSALSVLAQGLLHWQHFLIPVLPPHMMQYLQAPFPYLIGILSSTVDISKLHELGEILLINLDRNELETRNIPTHLIATRLPDLLGNRSDNDVVNSASDVLAQDLVELLKADKKVIFGDMSVVGEQAAKAAKAVKSAFGRLKQQGRKFLAATNDDNGGATPTKDLDPAQSPLAVTADEIYTEGSQNEMGEEEARVAFCTFFLCLYGDLKWYLGPPAAAGQTPQLDRDRFLQQKRNMGDGEGTPIFPLLQNMCQSQMFEQFVKARVEEIRVRMVVSKDSPLFLVCGNYHRQHNIDFSVTSVRRVTRQVAQANPSRLISQANANARRMAMVLTSNKGYEGDHAKAVAQLVEYCHETSVLMDVMSVMWMRLRDAKGNQWKHGLMALQIIRNVLYHGPLAAVAEATDGLDKIRQMKLYKDNMRAQVCQSIQQVAIQVYNLLVDRDKLFTIRRFCANRRREIRDRVNPNYQRDRNLTLRLSFKALHPYLHPQNNRQVAPANIPFVPPAPSQSQPRYPPQQQQQRVPQQLPPQQMSPQPQHRMPPQGAVQSGRTPPGRGPPQQQEPPVDLLGFSSPPQQQQVQAAFGAMTMNDLAARSAPPQSTIVQLPPQRQPQYPPPQQQQLPPPQQLHPGYGGQPGFSSPPDQMQPQAARSPAQPTFAQIPPQQYAQQRPYPGQMPPHQMPPHQMPPHQMPPHQMPPHQMPPHQIVPGRGPLIHAHPGHAPPPGQFPPGQAPPGPGVPQGYPGYPPQQAPPNLFAAAPPPQQQQQQPPQRPKASQFDPYA